MTASANLHRLATNVEALPRTGLIAVVKAVKQVAQAEGGTVAVWRKRSKSYRSVRLRAVDTIRVTKNGANARVQAVPVGIWAFVSGGADAHNIPKRRNKKKPARLVIGGNVVTGPVRHPGSRGDKRWRVVVKRAERIVPEVFDEAVRKLVR